jgi:NAD(P)-dependent dehydrogenase (short-subunit alcohol dehydrogenase family)
MADLFGYAGKRVVVTGGATGVGAALLDVLAEQGAPSVTVLDVMAPTGPHECFLATDLSDPSAIDAAIGALDGPIDVLFNNAGVNATAGIRTTIGVNFLAARRLAHGLLPKMSSGAAIVNTASSAGNNWGAHRTELETLLNLEDWEQAVAWTETHRDVYEQSRGDVYYFSKEALQLWTLRWSVAARSSGVRINSVCPAPIDTPLLADFRKSMTDKVIDWTIDQAGGRLMTAREVAAPLAFLGSSAASYINGVNLVLDGGFLAAMTTGQVDFSALAE